MTQATSIDVCSVFGFRVYYEKVIKMELCNMNARRIVYSFHSVIVLITF